MKHLKSEPRHIDILVLSDVHLGTYGCRAKELMKYLRSISPGRVILNGDIIDIWLFSKRYWPKSHMKVIRQIIKWMSKEIPVTYITGNHDEMLRKFEGFSVGTFEIQNKKILDLPSGKAWVFHGDVFDVTMQHSKWLTRLGSTGYDMLILINQMVNNISEFFGKGRISLSKAVKNKVKGAVGFINKFEDTVADIAISNGYQHVICGHIHHPAMTPHVTAKGRVVYLNSGDWIENLTALEYVNGEWSIFHYRDEDFTTKDTGVEEIESGVAGMSTKELYGKLVGELMGNHAVEDSDS
jgi:UDP-2,3-diacylglucosamine pyrophosphatase LpxH